jgi:O-antigen/teichoic acid export membrane protein
MAVTLAEMATYLPSAVSSVFLPHVAGSRREDADRHVTTVARSTILLTGAAALMIAPLGTILISVVLPAFTPALPALYVLLPAVVSLAIARVVGEYVSGLGLTARTSAATVVGFVVNIGANVVLIPLYGIVGAAAASLISYTTTAVIITLIASRLARAPMRAFWIPGPADVRFVVGTAVGLARRFLPGSRRAGDGGAY